MQVTQEIRGITTIQIPSENATSIPTPITPIKLSYLFDIDRCVAPCWENITPQKTNTSDILDLLTQSTLIDPSTIDEAMSKQRFWFRLKDNWGWGSIDANQNFATDIFIEMTTPQPISDILQYITPYDQVPKAKVFSKRAPIHAICHQPVIELSEIGVWLTGSECLQSAIDIHNQEALRKSFNSEMLIEELNYYSLTEDNINRYKESIDLNLLDFTFYKQER